MAEATSTTETETRVPFHEAIINVLEIANASGLECLASLLLQTKIPKNHDAIAWAWRERATELGWGPDSPDVAADVLSQKPKAEEAAGEVVAGADSAGTIV